MKTKRLRLNIGIERKMKETLDKKRNIVYNNDTS
jgi:hypothetical protein